MKQQEIQNLLTAQIAEQQEESEWCYAPLTDELKQLVKQRKFRYYPNGLYGPYVDFGGNSIGVAKDGSQYMRTAKNFTLAIREGEERVYVSFVGKPTEE